MATPNMDLVIKEFAKRVGFVATFDSNSNLLDGDFLPARDIVAYVNRAAFQLIEEIWIKVAGDKQKFVNMFPELVGNATASTFSNTTYQGTNIRSLSLNGSATYGDYFTIIDGNYSGSNYIKVWPQERFNIAVTNKNTNYVTTNITDMSIISLNKTLYLFPVSSSAFSGIDITPFNFTYIRLPLNPNGGTMLTQNGSVDIPFYPIWFTEIAERAQKLYLIDSQYEKK